MKRVSHPSRAIFKFHRQLRRFQPLDITLSFRDTRLANRLPPLANPCLPHLSFSKILLRDLEIQYRVPKDQFKERVSRMLVEMDLEGYREAKAGRLSGGYNQLLLLAC